MEQEAAKLVPAAEAAVQAARQAALALRGTLQELSLELLHDLAAKRLQAWLREHPDAADFQVRPCTRSMPLHSLLGLIRTPAIAIWEAGESCAVRRPFVHPPCMVA